MSMLPEGVAALADLDDGVGEDRRLAPLRLVAELEGDRREALGHGGRPERVARHAAAAALGGGAERASSSQIWRCSTPSAGERADGSGDRRAHRDDAAEAAAQHVRQARLRHRERPRALIDVIRSYFFIGVSTMSCHHSAFALFTQMSTRPHSATAASRSGRPPRRAGRPGTGATAERLHLGRHRVDRARQRRLRLGGLGGDHDVAAAARERGAHSRPMPRDAVMIRPCL